MSRQPLLVIAAGGTGGHMFPAQALAEEMLRRGWRVKLSTDPRGARYTGGFSHSVQIEVVKSGSFSRGGLLAKLAVPFQILAGSLLACWRMLRDRPSVVAGFGGYPAIPAMVAAIITRVPRIIHEQNGVLGRVNQLFAKRVHKLACGIWPTELPHGVEGVFIGSPVRKIIQDRAGADYIDPGDWPMSILVIGGSQGARVLAQIMPQAVALLPDPLKNLLRVAQQAREEDVETCKKAYAMAGVSAEVEPFFRDVPRRLSEAQLIVSRSGASSVADISVIGRPSILVPLASAIRDEQTVNAKGLVDADAAILLPESQLTPESLAEMIKKILTNPKGARKMAQAALAMGKPDAAKELADLVQSLKTTGS